VTGDDLSALEHAVLAQAPPGAVVTGLSISPDGDEAAVLTYLASANYLIDDLFEKTPEGWKLREGGSAGGINWPGGDTGVLRYSGEAPDGAQFALVKYELDEHRVPIRHGHFLFVAWDAPFATVNPALLRFG
jgi:hypothetical protein